MAVDTRFQKEAVMSPSRHLLLIDDDEELGRLLRDYLARFSHQLQTATTAAEGLRQLRRSPPDLLILDLMLPDKDGMTLCREIRRHHDVPIIMLTARGDVADRIVGLELGADDYLTKPFEPRELVARIESVLRRAADMPGSKLLGAADLVLEESTRRVTLAGRVLDLTTMEFELLRVFMRRPRRVLSREQLLLQLRGFEAEVYDRSVDMLVSRLRHKLGEDSRAPRFIKTIWRTGYQFIGQEQDD